MSLNISQFKVNDTSAYLTGVDMTLEENKNSLRPASCDSINSTINSFIDKEAESRNYLFSIIDNNGIMVFGITTEGDIYYDNKSLNTHLSNNITFNDIVDDLTTNDINKVLSAKQGIAINDLIDNLNNKIENVNNKINFISNERYLFAIVDNEEKIVWGIENNGKLYEPTNLLNSRNWLFVITDNEDKILFGILDNGTFYTYSNDIDDSGNNNESILKIKEDIDEINVDLEQLKTDLSELKNTEYNGEVQFNKSVGYVSTDNTIESNKEWTSLTSYSSINEDAEETLTHINRKRKSSYRRMVAINHDDLPIFDYISQRKLLNKYNFTSSFSYILRPFTTQDGITTAQKNIQRMIDDGQSIILHATLDNTSPFASPLYEIKPNEKTNFVPSLDELKPLGDTNYNSLGLYIDNTTKFNTLGFVYPIVDVEVVNATEEQYLEIISRYSIWGNHSSTLRSAYDLYGVMSRKTELEWYEHIYNTLIDSTLGYSTYDGTILERYMADYDYPSGGDINEYYPDVTHIKNGKIKHYSEIDNTTEYTWYAWKSDNKVVYTISETPSIGDTIYVGTDLSTDDITVSTTTNEMITDNNSIVYDRFSYLDVTNHLDINGYQSVGVFKTGLFKGCATSMNIEIVDRIILLTRKFFKHYFGTDKFDGYTAHGGYRSNCLWVGENYKFFDREHHFLCNEGTKIYNTRVKCKRSLYDVFENNGLKIIVNSPHYATLGYFEGLVYLYEGESDIRPTHLYCEGTPSLPTIAYPNLVNDEQGGIKIMGLEEFYSIFGNIDNWGKYILDNEGTTITSSSGNTYVISTWFRICLEMITQCFGTGKIPLLSFDTIKDSSIMKAALELLYQFCYNNDIDIVSYDEARQFTINTPKRYMTNYFPNPSFKQTIKDFYGTTNERSNIVDGFNYLTFNSNTSVSVNNETIEDIDYNVLSLSGGRLSTRIYGLQPGTYTFSCYAKQNNIQSNALGLLLRKNKEFYLNLYLIGSPTYIPVSTEWSKVEYEFIIPTHKIIHDGTEADIICNGYHENISNVQIIFNSSTGNVLEIANPKIIFNN